MDLTGPGMIREFLTLNADVWRMLWTFANQYEMCP